MIKTWIIFLFLVLILQSAPARPQQNSAYTPKTGSAERKAVLDAMRKPIVKQVGQNVIFHDVVMKVKDGWAFVTAVGKDPKGGPLRKFDGQYFPSQALLRKKGRVWQVLSVGSGGGTDVADQAMQKFPQAPREIFLPYKGPTP